MAAHLRPIEKDDGLKSGSRTTVVWNPMTNNKKGKEEQSST